MTAELIGYTNRLSASPGEALRFMVSTELPEYRAALVRLIHGDENPAGPGFKEEELDASMNGLYRGRRQQAHAGSYILVQPCAPISRLSNFTLQAWIFPTTPDRGDAQGLMTLQDGGGGGFCLAVGSGGGLALTLRGPGGRPAATVAAASPMHAGRWYFAAAAFDAALQTVRLYQLPDTRWPADPSSVELEEAVDAGAGGSGEGIFLIAAAAVAPGETGGTAARGLYNGKIDSPRLFDRALSPAEIARLREGAAPDQAAGAHLVAAWDFAACPDSSTVRDSGPHGLHGVAVNRPARAVTGRSWKAAEADHRRAPDEYAAIHFHDDDLEDAGWAPDFGLVIPEDLPSGVYAARLTGGKEEDHIPFVVRSAPGKPSAPLLFLLPTFTYLAYANDRMDAAKEHPAFYTRLLQGRDPHDLYLADHPEFSMSLYDRHSDGSGCIYSSMLRPIANIRPKYRHPLTDSPRHFGADLYLIDWLEEKRRAYDVVSDGDLHAQGEELLADYRVVATGTHPEYWTAPMLAAMESYLRAGGRLMYLGGNGFFWVTSVAPDRPHVIEVRRGHAGTRPWNSSPGECYHSTTGELGGLWRHRGRPPNRLAGVGFTAQGWGDPAPGYRRMPGSFDARAAFIFEGISETETIGDFGMVFGGSAGDELDRLDFALGSPPHTLLLASSSGHGPSVLPVLEDYLQMTEDPASNRADNVRADMVYFEHANHGAVFSVGSICWCASLSHNGYDNNVSRVTENVLDAFSREGPLP